MKRSLCHGAGPNAFYAFALFGFPSLFLLSSHSLLGSGEHTGGGGQPTEWFISPEPILVLGGIDGGGPEMFGSVVGAAWAGDGSILVADAMADQIRRFGPDGTHLSTLGREGGGPGEFRNLWGVFPGPGDTIWGYNQNVGISGFFAGEHQRNLDIYRGDPVGWVGARVVATGIPPLPYRPGPRSPGLHRDPWRVVAHAPDGSAADTLARGLSKELRLSDDLVWGRPIVAREPYVALGSNFIVYGDGGSTDLLVLDLLGDTLAVIQLAEITGSELKNLADARRAARLEVASPDRRPQTRRVLESIPVPERISNISDVVVDSGDRIWIRQVFMPTDSVARWDVHDRNGAGVAWIQIPVDLTVRAISEDALLGTDRDSMDVSRVLIYGLRK